MDKEKLMANEGCERRMVQSSNNTGPLMLLVITALVLIVGVLAALRLFEWERPTIKVESEVTLLGRETKLNVLIVDQKSGLREVRTIVRQGKKEAIAFDRQLGRSNFLSKGVPSLQETMKLDVAALGLSDGAAELLISARDLSWWNFLRGNQVAISSPVTIDTKPPLLRMVDSPAGIKPGSSGIIVYGASEEIVQHGITIDGIFHPGFPIPTRKDWVYGAMIGIPYDTEAVKTAAINGQDLAGNQASLPIPLKIRPVKKKSDTITLSESFLNTKIPEFAQYYPEMKGTQLEQFLFVNNEVRKQNAERIKEICSHPDPAQHWQGAFGRMENSAPMAGFAQHRSYFYQDKEVDYQVHLGVDLASLQRAEVKAANNGKVVFADYLGIYGNMVIIDHGQGIFSLYSHLSEIVAQSGAMLKSGDVLGRTGTTGMAGGDHLHFAMLINGVFVTPIEWWDEHWIKDNVLLFFQDVKPAT